MGTLRKLKRSIHGSHERFEHVALEPLSPVRKMSEVLLEFAEPLLEEMGDEQFGVAISMAACCWNVAFLPPTEAEANLQKILRDVIKRDALARSEMLEILHWLVDRKKALFGDDNRMIINYKVVEEEKGPRLLVVSAPPGDKWR